MLPILPEISLRPTAVTPDVELPTPSGLAGFSNILQGFDEPTLPAQDNAESKVQAPPSQGPFEISLPGTAPFHFSRPLDLQVTGKVLPSTGSAAPDDGKVLPLADPVSLTRIEVPADPAAGPQPDLADQSADTDAPLPEEAESPLEPAQEDVDVRVAHLAVGEQGPISAKAPDPAFAPPASSPASATVSPAVIASRFAAPNLPKAVRMAGPVPVREAMLEPVAPQQEPQRVAPIQANAELPFAASGAVPNTASPVAEEAPESGQSFGVTSALQASTSRSVNLSTSAVSAAAADPAAAQAVNAPAPAPSAAPPVQAGVVEPRAIAALETAIEHLAEAREAGRAARSQVTLSHQEFGAISLKIEASGNDLRATLASRDPGFVPAIQAALAERGIGASGEASSMQSQRGGEQSPSQQGNQGQSQQGNTGTGGMADPRYGFSSGSGNASNLPYRDQTGASKEDQVDPARSSDRDDQESESARGGLFA